ncbi:NAD(P)-dependent glycerol-3-phosphate dehydrogenase [Akkermansiaceae bacterium]|nr:NAD(P)-dependent glycerol-3-phosphate dehydrogenase [Akkermansiaceae bacterium]
MSSSFKTPLVVGSGSWGTGLALLLANKCPQVHLLGRNPETIREINSKRENKHYLPGITLPPNLIATTDPTFASKADLILFVVPTSITRAAAENLAKESVPPSAVLLSCSKGIERETGKRMSEIISDNFPDNPVAVFSGPNHAEEIARGLPAAATIGCSETDIGEALQHSFSNDRFRCYTNEDVAGIELGGALKNIFAIAAGVAAGLELGDNAISALVTRALAEMIRLGTQLGGNPETFPGLSGLGDLMTTCFSPHSRNQRIGVALGKGRKLHEAVAELGMVAEGVPNTRSIYEAARRVDARTPIIDVVYAMLYEDVPPAEALDRLFSLSPRNEVG